MVDGAFGMAYGVSVTSSLLFFFPANISPAIASAVMHFSEIFNTGYAAHIYRKNNLINKRMFNSMIYPAIVGAIVGSIIISVFSKHFVGVIKPFIAFYFIVVAIIILFRAFHLFENRKRLMSIPVLSLFGAFMDSVGGGGWGALVTSALIVGGRDMRTTIGTAHAIKFLVVLASSATFLTVLGIGYLWIVLWVSLGSIIAVPISIKLSNKIPKKWGLVFISLILIILSVRIILTALNYSII